VVLVLHSASKLVLDARFETYSCYCFLGIMYSEDFSNTISKLFLMYRCAPQLYSLQNRLVFGLPVYHRALVKIVV
jgi:hypothetical protein